MGLGILRFENCLIECSWMASHIPIVMVISMYNFHWCCWRRAMHRSYLHVWFDGGPWNWSWQYVNFMNWLVCVGYGLIGVWLWFGAPIIHRMSNLSFIVHWHVSLEHEHGSSQSSMVDFGGWP